MYIPTSHTHELPLTGSRYDYYFEADRKGDSTSGHRHDWENVVVFVRNDTIRRVVGSVHGKYHHRDNPLLQDGHPLIVYYKRPMTTHGLQFAKDKNLKKVENHYGEWVIADLIGWDRFPTEKFRNKLSKYDYRRARFHLAYKRFLKSLHKTAGKYVPGFNPNKDGGEEYNLNPEKINIRKGKKNKDKVEDKKVKSIKGDDKEEDKGEEKKEDDDSKKRINIKKEKENDKEKSEDIDPACNAELDLVIYCTCHLHRFADLWRDSMQQTT
ncbi:uncharacterized protein FPRO_11488 [Fusarium proliferatum ET1]|uniref:Uncharacterized protein n=1 Tax=Fusarium proliferatum (strain ET1) TaxID=1227346 RepID=A0A1L7W197_FUSPR|nr:uncharacterized protein FPRO_11488 [Fusarium proliferatum ET1]CZR46041.1 uncharacterized protein FPRO_11488 [Fusarium proliferatum ET1]